MSDYRTFAECSENAQAGNLDALYELGVCYAEGKGVEKNYQMAGKMWLQAAKQKHALSQMSLGILFEEGLDVTQNYDKAVHCYQVASQQNLPQAHVRLAKMYYKGLGVEKDLNKAISLCIQAAEQGEPEAQYYLATAYYLGIGRLKKNNHQAIFWYQQASIQNHEQATQALKNLEQQKDYEKPAVIAKKTVKKPIVEDFDISLDIPKPVLLKPIKDTQQKETEEQQAVETATEVATVDNVEIVETPEENKRAESTENTETQTAETETVMEKKRIHVQSIGGETQVISMKVATIKPVINFDNFTEPMDADADTVFQQGVKNLNKNLPLAIQCFCKSAENGHAKAQYNASLALLFGMGGQAIDPVQAMTYLQQSAEQKFRPACVVMGWIYQGGLNQFYQIMGQPQNDTSDSQKALDYYQQAGELGHAQAQYFLAKIYETGKGVETDKEKSLTWLRQSAKQGYSRAYELLEKTIA